MKVVCNRERLLAAFQTAASVAPNRSPKPILQNVKMEVQGDQATLLATDLEIGIRVEVPGVECESPGSAILSIARFGQILRESSDEKLYIEATEKQILVRGDRSEFKLSGEGPEGFPNVAQFQEAKYHEVSARLLRELIRRTVFATDNESSRYALGGVLLEFEDKKVVAVGTDGRRLAKMEGPANSVGGHGSSETTTIVPTRAMQLLERALSDDDGDVLVSARANEILVKTPRVTIYARLLEGRFPRWRDVFPSRTDAAKIEMIVGPFYAAVRQARIVTSEESKGVDFTFHNGMVVLAGHAAELGESHIELPIAYEGAEVGIALDPSYVIDFLKVLDAEKTFTLEVKDSESAAVCSTDDGYGYVIMPLARDR